MNAKQMEAMIAQLKAENEALKQAKASKQQVSFKVSEKGAVSAYGLGRWPVTLYKGQWEALLAKAEMLKKFIAENEGKLSTKD